MLSAEAGGADRAPRAVQPGRGRGGRADRRRWPRAAALAADSRRARQGRAGGGGAALRAGRPPSEELRRLLPRLRSVGRGRAALAARRPCRSSSRRPNGRSSRPASSSAPDSLERVLADLYGPADAGAQRRAARRRRSPATPISCAPSPVPCRAAASTSSSMPPISAAPPDGRWWVLGDRAQAPSGMGYAVENRLALATALPHLLRDMHVERLAGFFQDMRSALGRQGRTSGAPRIGLLTPGPANETYFEHAYLARYLGFLLVEGGDLMVQDGAVYVRTIEGPKRIDVLMRRLDADFCDPLEFTAASRIGVPGLVRAVRGGAIALANSLGAGLIEAPAMLAFMPALRAAPPRRRPDPAQCRDLVVRRRRRRGPRPSRASTASTLRRPSPAAAPACPAARRREPRRRTGRRTRFAAPLHRGARARRRRAGAVRLSTMPAWTGAAARPAPLRAARLRRRRRPQGWRVMRGGFCRVGDGEDPARPVDAEGRPLGRCLGHRRRAGRAGDAAAAARPCRDPTASRPSAEPRRRQPVLARTLSRAGRGDAAPGADRRRHLGRGRRRAPRTAPRRLARLLVSWGATEDDEAGEDVAAVLAETLDGDGQRLDPGPGRAPPPAPRR